MLFLLLAVLTSASVSIIMRLGESRVKNSFAMFMTNYFTCSIIAAVFLLINGKTAFSDTGRLGFAIGLGILGGFLYLSAFVLLKFNIGKNGVMLSSVFMKLGVLVPALMAIVIFHEAPTIYQLIGMVIAVAAIVIIYFDPKAEKGKGHRASLLYLIALLLLGGLVESLANIYEKAGNPNIKDIYMLCVFFTAALICVVIVLIKRKPVCFKDILFGVLIGIPNYFATRFLILSLSSVPAFVTYPVYNIGAVIIIGIAGILLFKEKANKRKYFGFALIAAALVLLNI